MGSKCQYQITKHNSGKSRRQRTEGMTALLLIISGFVLQVGNNISILWHHVTWLQLQHVENKEFAWTFPSQGVRLFLLNVSRIRQKSLSAGFPSFLVLFHSLQRMKLVRLCPLLPRQQSRVYCVHAGLTKSTGFPRAIRKGIGGDKEAVKEDCSNKTRTQERGEMWGEEGQRRGIQGHCKRKALIEGWWREEVKH